MRSKTDEVGLDGIGPRMFFRQPREGRLHLRAEELEEGAVGAALLLGGGCEDELCLQGHVDALCP